MKSARNEFTPQQTYITLKANWKHKTTESTWSSTTFSIQWIGSL